MSNTPKFDLNKPEFDQLNWHTNLNSNFDKIDAGLMQAAGSHIGNATYDAQVISPSLLNRVLSIQDGAVSPNTLEIHQVYIPYFMSEGFTQTGLNDILCGGFWIDKFQACQPAASNVSLGGLTANNPGSGVGAACKPHVVPWTEIDWTHARTALENRGGDANKSNAGTPVACAVYGSATNAKAEFLVDSAAHIIGRHIEIVQDGVTYYRRIVKAGISGETKYVKIYPELPATITTDDTYTIIGHHMVTPYEWFSISAWAMKYRYQHGFEYPKGNNNWGKDIGATRSPENEGLSDLTKGGYDAHEISRCLTGSGPLSWSLNGRQDGVWDLNGNVWEWVFQQISSDGAAITLDAGYPGGGTDVTISGSSGSKISALYAGDAPADGFSENSDIFLPTSLNSSGNAEYGYDGAWYNIAAATYAALRGGYWDYGSLYGLFALNLSLTPSISYYSIGFRGAF